MPTKTTNLILSLLIVAVFAAGAYVYPNLPDQIAVHWNAAGEADGFAGKFWGTFLFPLTMLFLLALYFVIPRIDPLGKNFQKFIGQYNSFWVCMMIFMGYIFGLQTAWNLGKEFDFGKAIIIAVAALWFAIGAAIENSKRNWFFGIRTPWTISSDKVWDKTHKLGGKLFKFSAILVLLAGIFLKGAMLITAILIPSILTAIWTIAYSYLEFKKTNK